ncbi:MAG: C-terminal binding protein [Actinobacteria bacterium]|nr:C-terminal binding protein [Actinomycetota bacterium]
MARVLCDPSVPLEHVRDVLAASEAVVETSVPPWSGEDVVALVSFEPVTAGDLGRLPGLRVVAAPSVGFDHVDLEAATRLGIWVCHVPDYCIEEMADHALALLLSLVRGVVELDRSVRSGAWDSKAAGSLRRVSDVRLGVIGFGRIGRELAARARALGMEVCAHDPFLSDEEISAGGVQAAALDDLLRTSTAISIHAPLTPETRGLIGSRELALLPAGAYVVNVSRAGLVDTGELLQALESGHLGGVALDVLDVEPPSERAKAPSAPRLVVTPHAGWYSERAEEEAHRRAAESVLDVLEGRRPRDAVNEAGGC